jgi:hypothetical protein
MVSAVRMAWWNEILDPDAPIPEGARVVTDFYVETTIEGWGPNEWLAPGRRIAPEGATYLSGYLRERLTTDPEDNGREIPAAEDPRLEQMREEDLLRAQGQRDEAAAAEEPEDPLAPYSGPKKS